MYSSYPRLNCKGYFECEYDINFMDFVCCGLIVQDFEIIHFVEI